jgi:hypothetical protein
MEIIAVRELCRNIRLLREECNLVEAQEVTSCCCLVLRRSRLDSRCQDPTNLIN